MNMTKNEHGFYEVRIKSVDGKTHTISTKQRNKQDAKQRIKEAKLEELEKAAELGVLTQDVVSLLLTGRKTTVENSMDEFKEWLKMQNHSQRSIDSVCTWVLAWANQVGVLKAPLMSIKVQHIQQWINDPSGKNKASTRGVMLSALRSFFRFVSGRGWITGNPAALVRVDFVYMGHNQKEVNRKECFSDEEVKLLLEATSEQGTYPSKFWHFAVACSRCYGLRLGDICGMEWETIYPPDKSITVWTEKRDRRVQPVLMEPVCCMGCWQEALAAVEVVSGEYLFPEERNRHNDSNARSTFSVQFSRLCAKLGIEGKSFHCLRASYCTACDEAGVPIEHIARSVGHANTKTTEGYIR